MSANQIEEVEKLLSRQLLEDESKELFLNAYDNWQLKDSSIVIQVIHITFEDDKNRGEASISVRNEKLDFTKIATMPIKFERGDWYIGG
jgi:NADPH-dependent 7-cyano-7-deazaguanine reductase QueF-like protein